MVGPRIYIEPNLFRAKDEFWNNGSKEITRYAE